jgi:hypothetical protein
MLCVAHWQAKVKVLAVSLIDLHDESTEGGVCEFACVPVTVLCVCQLAVLIPDELITQTKQYIGRFCTNECSALFLV